ncbi:MAG: cyclic nucleotide-binding domain-containing protein [Planctomycetota bacterium]|jgi:CRP-like cAMP-binding protein
MKAESLAKTLRQHPFLQEFSPAHFDFLSGCAANVTFAEDQLVAEVGHPGDATYLLRTGAVTLEVHTPGRGDLIVSTVRAGQMLGWSWLFPPHTWHLNARATEPVRAFRLDGACLRKKCEADKDFGYALVKRILYQVHRRLEGARLQALDVYGTADAFPSGRLGTAFPTDGVA